MYRGNKFFRAKISLVLSLHNLKVVNLFSFNDKINLNFLQKISLLSRYRRMVAMNASIFDKLTSKFDINIKFLEDLIDITDKLPCNEIVTSFLPRLEFF